MDFLTSFLGPENIDMFTRVFVAMALGALLGIERVFAHKTAGMRTYSLVAMGAALFTVISAVVTKDFTPLANFDPLRVASQIVVGLGFLGGGIIIFHDKRVSGLTTAAGLWVSGAIGVACGFALYPIASFVTVLTLFIFSLMWFLECGIKKISGVWDDEET